MSRQIEAVVEMPDATPSLGPDPAARRHWMSVLATAPLAELERAWTGLRHAPQYNFLRQPETGLAMVRGRIGGTGDPFNVGEMTLTRCAVQLSSSPAPGFGYVAGRSHRHAELAAVFDALLQSPAAASVQPLIDSLADARHRRRTEIRAASEATKVDFFTLVRE
jgi:alpha-D-ribose 1-methylphosphonate 5-triphosphate synthase subunit PhnG